GHEHPPDIAVMSSDQDPHLESLSFSFGRSRAHDLRSSPRQTSPISRSSVARPGKYREGPPPSRRRPDATRSWVVSGHPRLVACPAWGGARPGSERPPGGPPG